MIIVILFLLVITGYFLYAFIDWKSLWQKAKYRSNVETKYNRFNNVQKKQFYNELLELNKNLVLLETDAKKAKQRVVDFGEAMPQDLLIREMAISLKIGEFEKRYGVKLDKKYLNNDVRYLQQFI